MTYRSYTELIRLKTYRDRLEYLMLYQIPGEDTFGGLRHLNQKFYSSREWGLVRNHVIARDNGFDLGCRDYPISGRVYVHHMNPITPATLTHSLYLALEPEFLITTSLDTHNKIHFLRDISEIESLEYTPRQPGDTKLW